MFKDRRRPAVLTCAALLAVVPALGTGAAATSDNPASSVAQDEPVEGKLLLMLDASGSMKEKDPSGGTKMEAAKKALTGVVDTLPDSTEVGLRVYGATQPGGKPTPKACKDTQLVAPVAPLDKDALKSAIDGFEAKGETPISYSLEQALGDLGTDGKRNIVLVSDGEESCAPDPCPAITKLVGDGVDLQIDTVGFGVGDKARKQLQCLADAGHGSYYDAADADALASSLAKVSQRALRPFTVSGTPVTATESPADAPAIEAGQYLDTYTSDEDITRYYRVRRTIPGSTLRAAATARLPLTEDADDYNSNSWKVELTPVDDPSTECSSSWILNSDTMGQLVIMSRAVASTPPDPGEETSQGSSVSACADARELLLSVQRRSGSRQPVPTEIRVIEEPPAADAARLPPGVPEVPEGGEEPVPTVDGAPKSVVGGFSFNDAETVGRGNYTTTLVPGEVALFKVPLTWGQGATMSVTGPAAGFTYPEQDATYSPLVLYGNVFAPDFSQMDSQELQKAATFTPGGSNQADTNVVPPIRYRNRWDSPEMYFDTSHGFALAGEYYLAVGVGKSYLGSDGGPLDGQPVPVAFTIDVTGTPAGDPLYESPVIGPGFANPKAPAASQPSADGASAPSDRTETHDAPTPWWAIGSAVGAVALLALGALLLALRSRRRRTTTS